MTFRALNPFNRKHVPVRREEKDPFALLRNDLDELFDNFFSGVDIGPFMEGSRSGVFTPRVDVSESDKEIRVSAELPGMDEKDIDLSLGHDSLTIKGEKKNEKEEKGSDYYHVERSYGSFSRTIPLPVEIESEKAEATFKKGILTVKIPKSAKAIEETKKINVKAE